MKIINFNKNILLLLIILNIIGIFAAAYSYIYDVTLFLSSNKFYLIPLIPVSFIAYFLTSICLIYVYRNKIVPQFLFVITFYVDFVYGLGAGVFYIIYMNFIGFSLFYLWYVIAHLFLGVISIYLLSHIKKINPYYYFVLFLIILIKDYSDIYFNTTSYLTNLSFYQEIEVIILIVLFQLTALFILYKTSRKHL